MKFSHFVAINEVLELDSIKKNSKSWAFGAEMLGKKINIEKFKSSVVKNGKLDNGTWYLLDSNDIDYQGPYIEASHVAIAMDSSGAVQCLVSIDKGPKNNIFAVDSVVGKKGSSIPAHKLYAALVRSGITLTTDTQTDGGKRVWQKLSAESGVVVHGWNKKTKQPINLGPEFDDDSDTHSTYVTARDAEAAGDKEQSKYERSVINDVILVATKK